jgi:hypothetical protein
MIGLAKVLVLGEVAVLRGLVYSMNCAYFCKNLSTFMRISTKISPYWMLLKDLSNEEKLSLIALLAKSLQKKKPNEKVKNEFSSNVEEDWVQYFSGSWNDFPETAEELIDTIEGARTQGRMIEFL